MLLLPVLASSDSDSIHLVEHLAKLVLLQQTGQHLTFVVTFTSIHNDTFNIHAAADQELCKEVAKQRPKKTLRGGVGVGRKFSLFN